MLEELSSAKVQDLAKCSFVPVGRCIYCGSTEDLRKEHIIPFGLSGTAVLPKASCGSCAKITGRLEQHILRGPMRPVRVLRQLKSRTKHADAPKTAPLEVIKEGKEQIIDLPLEEYPILLHFPVFPPPAFLTPSGYKGGIRISGVVTVSFGPRPEQVLTKVGATKIKLAQNYEPVAFARMIAKIAYAYATALGARHYIDGEPLPLRAIIGKSSDIGRWVGTLTKPYKAFEGLLHRVAVHKDFEKSLVIAEVQLFADSQSPNYGVILGRLKSL